MTRRALIVSILTLVSMVGSVLPAMADHSWNGYHWENRQPTVSDSGFDAASTQTWVANWAGLGGADFNPSFKASGKGKVDVSTGFNPNWPRATPSTVALMFLGIPTGNGVA